MTLFPRVVDLLRADGAGDVVVFGGGIIPPPDIEALRAIGVARIFTPGATMASITGWLAEVLDARRQQAAN
jgi:methylmalonyl-CoA mutase C-terminal domain/subunit